MMSSKNKYKNQIIQQKILQTENLQAIKSFSNLGFL